MPVSKQVILAGLDQIRREMAIKQDVYSQVSGQDSVPIPTDMKKAYAEYVWWRHMETNEPVRGINYLQAHYLDHCSCWKTKVADNGEIHRITGSDALIKSRKMLATSLMMGLAGVNMCLIPNTRVIVIMQRKTSTLMYPLWSAFGFMFKHLPAGWCELQNKRSSESYAYYFTNESSFELQTAGSSEGVADALVRSGTPNIVIMTEAGMYSHYDVVVSSVVGALPEHGSYLIGETTPSLSREHPFAKAFELSMEGRGAYQWAGFYPWHKDPNRVIPADDPRYPMVMTEEFQKTMEQKELDKEMSLKLSAAQKAWRRYKYLRGTPRAREQARREYPEDLATCYGIDTSKPYIHQNALDKMRGMIRTPIWKENLAHQWVGYVWDVSSPMVLITTDSATFQGEDKSVILAANPWTLDMVGMVHGHATPEMMMEGIYWLLAKLDCQKKSQHWISPETNYDDRIGFVGDHLMRAPDLRLWYYEYVNKLGEVKERRMPGYRIGPNNRAKFTSDLVRWIEGDPYSEEECGPLSKFPSSAAWKEANCLRKDPKTGKIEAPPGKKDAHDDIMDAFAGAIYTQKHLRLPASPEQLKHQASVRAQAKPKRKRKRLLR